MKIQIIGLGTVGKAEAFLLSKLGHKVYGYDVNPEQQSEYAERTEALTSKTDLTLICTRENQIGKVVETIAQIKAKEQLVIKSTVPVGTTEQLMKHHSIHICHNPEFLREEHSFEDALNPSRIVVGQCCTKHGNVMRKLYKPLNRPMYVTDPTTSELVKLASNSLRAVNISFWNEMHQLCKKVGADIEMLAEAANPGKVLNEWEGGRWGTKFFNKPYDGECLPKDMKHLITAFVLNGLNPKILEVAEEINEEFKC